MLDICRIEQDHVVGTAFRNIGENRFRQVAVRIYEPDSAAFADIVVDHVLEQRGFTHTRLTDDVDVATSIVR